MVLAAPPGGVMTDSTSAFEPSVEEPVGFVQDLRDDAVGLDDAAVDELLDAPRGSDDAPRVRANGGELRLFVRAADDERAWETRGGDVPFGVFVHLRGELPGG
jgi:hypothetical protein